MAAQSSRLFMLFILVITLLTNTSFAIEVPSVGNGEFGESGDRGSVKKELRNPDRWAGSGLSEEEEVEPIRGFYLDEGSQMLASFLRTASNEELGVTAMQVSSTKVFLQLCLHFFVTSTVSLLAVKYHNKYL